MDIFTANKIMEIALRAIYTNASTLDEADELARVALDHAADYHAAQANRGPLPAAEPLGYIAASKVEEMQREFKDSRIAGTGVMITKDPAEGRVAVYLAPQPAQGEPLSERQILDFFDKHFNVELNPATIVQFARDIESHSPVLAAK